MKKYLFIATALAALASCSSDEFVGDNTSPTANNTPGAIQFTSNAPRITRATAADYAKDLDYSFYVYATKTVGSTTSNVFAHNVYSETGNTPYVVWWESGTANKTSSNTYDWEYVGSKATGTGSEATPTYGTANYKVALSNDQTIKYWDYSATNYIFTAYKNNAVGDTPAAETVTNVTTTGFTFEGTAAQFAGLYVADKLTITNKDNEAYHGKKENKIGDVVVFTFRSGATKVRLGIYETIPGYQVRNVNFRPNNGEFTETKTNALLSGLFNDNNDNTATTATAKYNITYNSTSGIAEFKNTVTETTSLSKFFNFGTFAATDAPLEETSAAPTWASGSSAYQDVFPNTDHVDDMILYVDYELYNTTTQEVITVKGAKAVVPKMYMTWNPNYAYTYLFKISDNTNGTSGTEGTSPAGLFPITFDAVTIAVSDNVEGIITTLSAPAITTFQDGSVSTEGITYANANGPIYITVNTNGTLADLTNIVKLYTVKEGTTEADLMLTDGSTYNKTEVASDADDKLTVLDAAIPVGDITFAAGTTATFTPIDGKTYAFEYSKGVTYVAATGTYVSGTTYYTDATGATEVDTTGFTAGTTDVSQYFVKSPAVKAYKVIKIKEASNSGSSGSGDGGSRSF